MPPPGPPAPAVVPESDTLMPCERRHFARFNLAVVAPTEVPLAAPAVVLLDAPDEPHALSAAAATTAQNATASPREVMVCFNIVF